MGAQVAVPVAFGVVLAAALVLTGLGRQLFPVLVSLIEFGRLLQGDAKRLDLLHGDGCGAPVATNVQCSEGHTVNLTQTEARIRPKKKR